MTIIPTKKLTFEQFSKMVLPVDNEFIAEYNEIFNKDPSKFKYKFVISEDQLTEWLEYCDIYSFRRKLFAVDKDSGQPDFEEHIDYIVKNPLVDDKVTEVYMLTIDAAKRFAMTSGKKRKSIQKYFLEIEKVFSQYQHYIVTGILNESMLVKNGKEPLVSHKKGIIYINYVPEEDMDMDFNSNMISVRQDFDEKVMPLFVYETDKIDDVEICVKDALKYVKSRKVKDMYLIPVDAAKRIVIMCDRLHHIVESDLDIFEGLFDENIVGMKIVRDEEEESIKNVKKSKKDRKNKE